MEGELEWERSVVTELEWESVVAERRRRCTGGVPLHQMLQHPLVPGSH